MWQNMVRGWLAQQLRDKAIEAMQAAQAAPRQGPAPPPPPPDEHAPDDRSPDRQTQGSQPPTSQPPTSQPPASRPAPPGRGASRPFEARPADVGLVVALKAESGGLEDMLSGAISIRAGSFSLREGRLHGRTVAVIHAGVGKERAARATEALIAGHRPAWVISAGFSGALVDRVKKGDIVLANGFVDAAGERLDLELAFEPGGGPEAAGVHVGRLALAERIVRRPADKRALGAQTGALAADLESFAVARVCERMGARFLAVRVISDAVNDELPPEIDNLARQTSFAAQLGAAAGAIFRRPSSVKQMLELKEGALVASDKLARFLSDLIRELPGANT